MRRRGASSQRALDTLADVLATVRSDARLGLLADFARTFEAETAYELVCERLRAPEIGERRPDNRRRSPRHRGGTGAGIARGQGGASPSSATKCAPSPPAAGTVSACVMAGVVADTSLSVRLPAPAETLLRFTLTELPSDTPLLSQEARGRWSPG
jgi:hypothetical protein